MNEKEKDLPEPEPDRRAAWLTTKFSSPEAMYSEFIGDLVSSGHQGLAKVLRKIWSQIWRASGQAYVKRKA
jgi:hypothetical protein